MITFRKKKADEESKEDLQASILGKGRKKIQKKHLIAGGVIAVLLITGVAYAGFLRERPAAMAMSQFTSLAPSDFASTISATGTIEADRSIDVYSTQQAPVKEIFVEEGEHVEAGQVLARLDDKAMQQQIRLKEAALGVSAESAAVQVRSARNKYNAALKALQDGTNGSLVAAENAVESAKNQWDTAEKTWQDYQRSIEEGYNPELVNEGSVGTADRQAIATAEFNLKQAEEQLRDAQSRYNSSANNAANLDAERQRLRQERDRLQQALTVAQRDQGNTQSPLALDQSVNQAKAAVAAAEAKLDNANTPEEIEKAQENLIKAQANLDTILNDSNNELGRYNKATDRLDEISRKLATVQSQLADVEANFSRYDAEKNTYDQGMSGKRDAVEQARMALKNARENAEQHTKQNSGAKKTRSDMLATHRQTADTAKSAYEQAVRSLNATRVAANSEITGYEDSLAGAQVAGNDKAGRVELANMYENLQEMTIRAPMAGTLVKKYANVGNAPTGPLFKVENLNHLIISTELKEIDVRTVRTGMKVQIKTDATGDQSYYGRVVSIASSASGESSLPPLPGGSAAAGGNATPRSGDPTFKAKIVLENPPNTMLAGMKARLTIVLAEDQKVFSVPINAVYEGKDNQKMIVAAIRDEKKENRYRLKEIPVKTSLENDLNVVIEGDELKDGLLILNDSEGKRGDGLITITPTNAEKNEKDKKNEEDEAKT